MLKRGSRVTSALFLAQSLLISSIAVPVYATDIYGYETYNEETQLGNGESDGVIRDFAASENESPDDEYENEPSPKAVADETGNSQVGNDDAESDKSGVGDSDNDLISVDAAGSDNAGADEAGTSDVSITADESSMYTAEDMQAITDELKQKEEEPEENDLSPAVEKRLESQEEVLVGKPAATDVRNCADTGAFAQALSDINIDYPCDKVGEIAIDLKEGLITDENGEELIGADSSVLAAAEEREADAATEILEENGYKDVTCENGVISADDRYATARLFVMSSVPIDTRGALSVVSFGETYLVQYATPAEAAIAAEMLKDDEGVWEVMPDVVITVDSLEIPESDEILESEANSESGEDIAFEECSESGEEEVGRYFKNHSRYMSRAVSYMGIDRLLSNTGSVNTVVNVAVIDSGYDSRCSYVEYDRVLMNRAINVGSSSINDVVGHGTFVLNQIYEATTYGVRFIPVKMYDNDGYSSSSMSVSAIYKSVDAGADVINYSNGADVGYNETFYAGEAALQYALDNKCYLVASAGNDDKNTQYSWPAKSSRCLTISSISYVSGEITSYSNYGSSVDFAAPGGDEDGMIDGYTKGNKYISYSGTSQAAPYYTAVIANLKAFGRSYNSLSALIKSLTNYCEPYLTGNSSYYVGHGCVYLENAINRSISSKAFKDFGNRTYTGSAITPNPTVTYGGKKIMKGRDYELEK